MTTPADKPWDGLEEFLTHWGQKEADVVDLGTYFTPKSEDVRRFIATLKHVDELNRQIATYDVALAEMHAIVDAAVKAGEYLIKLKDAPVTCTSFSPSETSSS